MPHRHDKASDSSCTATTVIVALFFFVSLRTGDGNYSVVAAGTLGLDSTYLPDTGSPRNNPYYVQCSAVQVEQGHELWRTLWVVQVGIELLWILVQKFFSLSRPIET